MNLKIRVSRNLYLIIELYNYYLLSPLRSQQIENKTYQDEFLKF